MTPFRIQLIIAAVFLGLGSWCLLAPESVLALTVRPAYQTQDPLIPILIGCFGAQAVLAGVFAAFSTFTRRTFGAFAFALLPFFGFDYYFAIEVPVFNAFIWLDAVANLLMLILCLEGYRQLSRIRS